MPHRQIVFIFDEHDKHHELVLPHLHQQPIIFEPADIATGVELSFVEDGKREYAVIGDTILDNVGAIWWRKMLERSTTKVPLRQLEQTYGNATYADYARRSVRRHANALGAFFADALWVSNPYAMSKADNKAWQLQVANALGMSVPRTLQTSSPKLAKQFVKEMHGDCIVKSLSNRFPIAADGSELMFWSQKIHPDQKVSHKGLDVAPAIFQQAIHGYDVRVTVVGDKVFAAKITITDDGSSIRDWRIVGQSIKGKPTIEPYDLPKDIATKCIAMLKELGLQYGAFDFVVDYRNVHWFLEVNPMGAWGFIEEDTRLPIGRAMAALLESRLE